MSARCEHCNGAVAQGERFCCNGCEMAFALIHDLGLSRYYMQRELTDDEVLAIPVEQVMDVSRYVRSFSEKGVEQGYSLHVAVRGLHCASCVRLIEMALMQQEGVQYARLNMTTQRLEVRWHGERERAQDYVRLISRLGYQLMPFDPAAMKSKEQEELKFLLICLSVAGFASGNMMLISVSLWTTSAEVMGQAMRDLMHWSAALIAIPTMLYAGQPFFASAWDALKRGRTNMDVPISLALILTNITSLYETTRHGEYTYFDSVVMLLFFLLIGRYLDKRARGKARAAAQDLLLLMSGTAVVMEKGLQRVMPIADVLPDMLVLVAAGEKIPVDGVVVEGETEMDTSLITGETLPRSVACGDRVFAGTMNVAQPITMRATAAQQDSLLSEIVTLMEKAEQGQAHFVRIADRVARYYTPVVHILGLGAFLGWWLFGGMAWQPALMIAVAVLIITCPCALALAVPVVQVLASGRLMKQGILLKSGDALERLHQVDTVVLDKTGTLTTGALRLVHAEAIAPDVMQLAASMASKSKHPLSKALARAYSAILLDIEVQETSGKGLESTFNGVAVKLGSRSWCGIAEDVHGEGAHLPEIWLSVQGKEAVRFVFEDTPREDMVAVVSALKARGYGVVLLSGDRRPVVDALARVAGIDDARAQVTPVEKTQALEALKAQGRKCLMVGDGLNDAPALATALVSMSPSTAMDISQNAADIVFQGSKLWPMVEVLDVAAKSDRLVKENFIISFAYNVVAVPMAVMGMVTPIVAAIAMSSSSLVVIMNALRLVGTKKRA